ncbi:MAG: hypothetical protein OEY93_05155 [Anaerolineae bacterium]|nr:hypothetical protein [Anaerolineae bacterium]
MPVSVILHIMNEEPIIGEIEEMPKPDDALLILHNPRKRDGKDIHFLASNVTQVIWPWSKVNFLEIMPSEEDDQIFGFVRE